MSDVNELERLRAHNAELLSELKAAKAKARQQETDLAAVNAERDTALERLHAETTGRRVNALIDSLASAPMRKFLLAELKEQGRLRIDGETITLHQADGNPADINCDDHDAVYRWLGKEGGFDHLLRGIGASGGGAIGSMATYAKTQQAKEPEKPLTQFGLK